MTLSDLANIAELIGAIGIIVSLLFVGWEMRKSTSQARLSNWHAVLAALREHKRRTDNSELADVVVRGRDNYEGLKPSEKVMFGQWMEELLQAHEGLLQFRDASVIPREQLVQSFTANLSWYFAFPGCREWWRDSGLAERWPKVLVGFVDEAVARNETATVAT